MRTYIDGEDFYEIRATMERSSKMWKIEFYELDADPGTIFSVTCPALGLEEKKYFCWEVDGYRFGLEVKL